MKFPTLAVFLAASFAWTSTGPAAAQNDLMGGCVKNTRDGENNVVKVRTIVENNVPDKEYKVTIYDGSDVLGEETLATGGKIETNDNKMSGNKPKFDMKILIATEKQGTVGCFYAVSAVKQCNSEGGNCWARSTWNYWSQYSEVCPSNKMTISCNKTFRKGQDRWITTLAIKSERE